MHFRFGPVGLSALTAVTLAFACGGDDASPTDTGPGDTSTDTAVGDAAPDATAACIMESGRCDPGDTCCGDLVCREASSGDGFCVAADDVCFVGAQMDCCLDDADCAGDSTCYGAECRPMGDGICKAPPAAGQCWADRDCPTGMTCMDAEICPCGTPCFAEDVPGTCT